jgi:hypothetical protein
VVARCGGLGGRKKEEGGGDEVKGMEGEAGGGGGDGGGRGGRSLPYSSGGESVEGEEGYQVKARDGKTRGACCG